MTDLTNPLFPIFIVSKGRWESRYTAKWLIHTNVPFRMIVEEQEFDNYAAAVGAHRLLVLPADAKDHYDTFDDTGPADRTGSGPARNFAWDTAEKEGHQFHWTIDDNLRSMGYLHGNRRLRAGDGMPFRIVEEFALQYSNIAMAGPQYKMFAPSKTRKVPLTVNTRVFSCNLIRTEVPLRWRGRYNEDTDLSLRMLKAGYCTVILNMILQEKVETGSVKGGNTDEIYGGGVQRGGSTWDKTRQLQRMHPDVVKMGKRFGRWHHYINFAQFKTRLVRDPAYADREPLNWSFETVMLDDTDKVSSEADIAKRRTVSQGIQTLEELQQS